MKETYTNALLQLLTPEADVVAVLEGFKKTLKARGHEALYKTVLARVLRTLEAARASTSVVVANQAALEAQAAAIAAALKDLGADPAQPATPVFDETIIGGFVAEYAHTRTDQTYKTKLVSLYRSLTR